MTYPDEDVFYDEDGNPEYSAFAPKEEPDCYGCGDSGVISVNAAGERVPDYDPAAVGTTNCPDCNPTEEQRAAQFAEAERAQAEYERRVAAGEITEDEGAPF
jgi:hypothetical protein